MYNQLIHLLSGLLTPTILLLGAYIAWQQWRTNRNRLKHELFDRRFKVYVTFWGFFVSVLREGAALEEERLKFWVDTKPCYFLFNGEISQFIDEINRNAIHLQRLERESERLSSTEEVSLIRKQK